jgi:YcxB-like protein
VQTQSVVEVSGTLAVGDLRRFLYSRNVRPAFMMVVIVTSIVICLFQYNAIANNSNLPDALQKGFAPFAVVLLIWIGLIAVWPLWSAKKEFASQVYLRERLTICFTPDGISSEGTGVSSKGGWVKVKRVRETKSLFLLYYSATTALVLPKRFFQSPDEMERWRQLIASCVDPKLIEKPSFVGRWC